MEVRDDGGGAVSVLRIDATRELNGTIPAELGDALRSLRELTFHIAGLTGPIPAELGNLRSLESLNFNGNALTGSIPAELGDLSSLTYLNLSDNALTGPIPAALGNLSKLEYLDLLGNDLTGPIPAALGNLRSLEHLDLHHNALTGPIPLELGNLSSLLYLDLHTNQLTGCIPVALLRFEPDINPQQDHLALPTLPVCKIKLALSPDYVSEGVGATDVTVTASLNSSPLPTATTVSVSRTGGTATSGTDYAAINNFTVTIAGGSSSGTETLRFAPAADSHYEGSETVILTGTTSGVRAGRATLTIVDETLSVGDMSAAEGAGTLAFTVTLSAPSGLAVTVGYETAGGTATEETDYTRASGTLTFAPGETTKTVPVMLADDSLHEGNEQFELRLSAPANATLVRGTATGTIVDNDTAPTAVTLTLNPASVSEGAAATDVTVTAALNNSRLPSATTVTVSRTGGTATPGTDYPAVSNFTVTIAAGQASGTATLSFDPTEDSLYEGDETVILTGTASGLTADTATLTIADNDTAPTAVTLTLNPASVSEGAAATDVTVTAALNNSRLPSATTVTVSRTGGTATSGTDYPAISNFTVTIAAGQASGTATLSFDPTEDSLYEGDETVILTGTASGLTADTATLTIADNDTAPTAVTLTLNPASVSEGAAATDVTVTAALNNSRLPSATTVTVSRTGGTATPGTDYPAVSNFTVTIAAGQASGTATLSFGPTEDSLHEGDETVILTGTASGLTADTATLTITDNDTAPTAVTLSLSPGSVSEGAAATDVTVTAALNNSQLPSATTVTVSRTGGTATPGTDYPAVSNFTVTIAAGQASGTATLSFGPTEDSLHEGDETVILTGTASGLTADTATLTITDNDTAPTAVTLSLSPGSVSEGAAATDVTVTAALNNSQLPSATTVTVSRTGGTATPGTDYPAVSDFTVTIAAGQASGTATLSFDPTEDSLHEGNETVILTASASGLTSGTATLTITDNDTAPTAVTLSLSPGSVNEGAAATDVTVTAALNNSQLPSATTVTVSRTGGMATSGTDYPAISNFTVTIAAGQASGTATLSFDPTEDSLHEGDETVILTASASGLTSGTATLTITDNDTAPTAVTLSLSPGSVNEGAAATDVTVTAALNNSQLPSATTVTVSRTGGTATSGTDYPAISNFSVTIAADATSGTATLSFDPIEDIVAEGSETVILTGAASGLTSGTATLTITDNDTAPTAVTLSLNPGSVSEGAAATDITVTASLGSTALPSATTVTVSRTGGTATSGTDYPAISNFSVTIAADATSGTATLSFDPTEDSTAEGGETVILTGAASGLTSGTATFTITDNDTAPTAVTLSLNPNSVGEAAAATMITVTAGLNGSALPSATTVTVSRTGGTATSGTDYPAISNFSVTIAADATSGTATLSFDPAEDILAEGDETVILTGAASGLTSGTATLTIADNDAAPTGITLSLNPSSVGEGASATDITVTASLGTAALPSATTVSVSRTGGTATSGTDYPAISTFSVTIAADATSGTATLRFDPAEDSTAEGDETVILTGAASGLTSGTATLTITDNDTAPTAVTLSLNPGSVSEGASATDITVTASLGSTALPSATTVTVSRTGGTATSGTDYPAISNFSVTIAADATSGTATLSFDPTDDSTAEGSETVVLTGAASGLTSGTATLTITDNDTAPTAVTLSLNPNSVGEGDPATSIMVTAGLNGSARPLPTTVTVSRTGGTATSGTDYPAISSFSVTIAANATSGTATLSFDPADDSTAEGSETVILTGAASGLTSGTATLTITDNDTAPTAVTLSLNPNSVSEGAAATSIRVTAGLSGSARPSPTTVTVSVTGGTAISGTDYPAISNFSVTIAANATSGTATLSFDPTEDSTAEGDETVILTGAASGLTSGTATLTITDNDTAPTAVTLSLNPNSVSEGAAATSIRVTAGLNGSARPSPTTVTVSVTGGTAISGTDYPAVSNFSVTIAAGQASGTATLSFDPTEDSTAEGDETVILTGAASGLTSGTATLTITDNDTAPTAVTLSLNPNSVSEGAAATSIRVTAGLNGSARPSPTTVTVSVTGGTATLGTDYPAVSNFSVTIAAGQASGTATLSFDPTEDSTAEGDETVILTGAASGLTSGTATLTITDNDTEPTALTLSLSPSAVGEGDGAAGVTVTASMGSAAPSQTAVSVSVTGGTATAGADYAAVSPFTVTIQEGQTGGTAQLSFDPAEDSLAEGEETVIFTGSAAGRADTATLRITDNDDATTAVILSLSPNSVGEGAGATEVTVTAAIDTVAESRIDVSLRVEGSSAEDGVGFVAVPEFEVTILAGTRSGEGTFTLTPVDDQLPTADQLLTVTGTASLPDVRLIPAELLLVDNDRSVRDPYREVPAIAIWTDELGYRSDAEIRLYGDIDPKQDDRDYTVFFCLENIETGERLFLAPGTGTAALREEVVDYFGRGEDIRFALGLPRLEKALIWKGRVPGPGLWHFVAEFRSPDTTQVLRRAYAKFVVARNGFRLLNRPGFERRITTDTRWSNDWIYNLGHRLVVTSGATLTIEAGTLIRAWTPEAGIIVEQGGRIVVQGRREAPVVMTCAQPVGKRRPGCWGGLSVFGAVPAGGSRAVAEAQPPDRQLASSELRYLRVEFAGGRSTPEAPFPALGLHDVGAGTVIDHIQVHASRGDGLAFYGGDAHCGHCVASEAWNAALSWGLGWQGSAQHVYVQQGERGACGISGSGAGGAPLLYNLTLIGGYNIGLVGGAPGSGQSEGPGILLGGGAAVTARNVAVIGFSGYAVDARDESVSHFESGRSSVENVLIQFDSVANGLWPEVTPGIDPYVEHIYNNPRLLNIRYEPNPDPRPRSGSVALRLGNAAVPPPTGKMSPAAHYVGAFGKKNWLEEWTFFGDERFYDAKVD